MSPIAHCVWYGVCVCWVLGASRKLWEKNIIVPMILILLVFFFNNYLFRRGTYYYSSL